ncbi:alpha/beta fold hydrolase [Bacillus pseudomycoides]|uniref:alpha/beta fold hydrolase n=1 Tax=Bacillus pseudomycoides TaxID=64104 RepID=UPI0003311AAE|nr:alpha/beta hydrolase [Bacillus pseudomycoides]EOP55087.1 proline-specific peptidase [Bacillus cereus VD136]OOG93557.1 hypothetical protein BTH41_03550 [Bacillus mycoides]PEK65522.1 alpha/beta hydrolase [Bacillus pseudomycoides]PEL23811.1 alpha/beta hydrolase [Bacillus pseudomycoides]PGE87415.1 alpha/beta hydrolase [Bacillus pseudomycoides]
MKQEKEVLSKGKMIQVRGKNLYVEMYGSTENPPVLFLHGGPGEMCFDFLYHQAHRLQDSFRLIAIDQRGVGRSEGIGKQEPFGLQDIIEDCEALRKELGISNWCLIGHSFGGFLALLYGAMYPAFIQKIIFEAPTFDFELTARALLRKSAQLLNKYGQESFAEECIALSESKGSTRSLVEGYMKLSEYLGEKRMEIYTYNFNNPTNDDIYTEEQWDEFWNRSEIHYNRLRDEGEIFQSLLSKLKEIPHSLLLLIGAHDVVTCEKHIEVFQRDTQNGKVIVFEECGHTPHYEAADRFAETVIDFLK